jgi:hypothetical protein
MTGRPGLTDASLRDALRKRVAETSLRAVADEVGMSFNGLNHVLAGGSPQRKTREKLVRWYYSQSTGSRAIPHEDFETAIALVLSYLRDESKPRAVRERRLREVIDRLKEDAD